MPVQVIIETVGARLLAAVNRSVTLPEIAGAWRPALDKVWAFLRANPGLHDGGHNVFLYQHPAHRNAAMNAYFAVQVTRSFDAADGVEPAQCPAGKVAKAVHVGPYDGLKQTHDAIHAWAAAGGHKFAGWSWEIYGDWTDDPAKLETTIYYLLA